MSNLKIFIIFLIFYITGCNESPDNSSQKVLFTTQEIKIPITENQLSYYSITSYNKENNNFLGYNEFTHAIDIFSLDSSKFLGSIKLQLEGPDFLQNPNAFHQLNDDEFVSIDYYQISYFDKKGNVKQRVDINSKSSHSFFYENFLYPNQDNGFMVQGNKNRFIVFNANMKESTSVNPQAYYQNYSLFTKIDVEGNLIDLNIPFAKEYHQKFYGFNDLVFSSFFNETLYYNFSALPDIFSFNLKSKIVKRHQVSTNTLPLLKTENIPFDQSTNTGALIDVYLKSSNFGPILLSNDYIFRIYQSGAPEGQRNLTESRDYKEKIIQVFDKDYNLVTDIPFDFNITYSGIFNNENILYFQTPPNDDNHLNFKRYILIKP